MDPTRAIVRPTSLYPNTCGRKNMTSSRSDFSRHVRASFRKQKIMRLFRARISRLERGLVEISAKNRPDLEQQDGFVHAGALVALADSAGGYAALPQEVGATLRSSHS